MKTLKNNDEIIKKAFEDWDKDALELFLEEYGFYIEKALWLKDKQTKDKIKKHGEKRMKPLSDKIREELQRGIERNGTLPLDWAMDRINPIIAKAVEDLKEAINDFRNDITEKTFRGSEAYNLAYKLEKKVDKIFGDFKEVKE